MGERGVALDLPVMTVPSMVDGARFAICVVKTVQITSKRYAKVESGELYAAGWMPGG